MAELFYGSKQASHTYVNDEVGAEDYSHLQAAGHGARLISILSTLHDVNSALIGVCQYM